MRPVQTLPLSHSPHCTLQSAQCALSSGKVQTDIATAPTVHWLPVKVALCCCIPALAGDRGEKLRGNITMHHADRVKVHSSLEFGDSGFGDWRTGGIGALGMGRLGETDIG